MKRLFLAGHKGMVGSALLKHLEKQTDFHILTKTRSQLDLLDQSAVATFFRDEKPDEVILAAARVGGIAANNSLPAEFIYENIQIQSNVIHFSHVFDVKKLLFLGSSCIYPKLSQQPIKEEALLCGRLEPTNEPYAIAKIAGIKMCESYNRQYGHDFRCVMPTNLYGPRDNYHPERSHVIAGLIKRIHTAKKTNKASVTVWGSGDPLREFLFVDDFAKAVIQLHNMPKSVYIPKVDPMMAHINIGSGYEVSIRNLAQMIAREIGYTGTLTYDTSRPDGTKRKNLDLEKMHSLGLEATTPLKEGLKLTYKDFLKSVA